MTQDTGVNAIPRNDKSADRTRRTIKITGPVSYPTGGDPISLLNDIGLANLHMIACAAAVHSAFTSCRVVGLNKSNPLAPKLVWFGENFNEIANGTDLSAYSVEIEFIGND